MEEGITLPYTLSGPVITGQLPLLVSVVIGNIVLDNSRSYTKYTRLLYIEAIENNTFFLVVCHLLYDFCSIRCMHGLYLLFVYMP